jgi:hypothetical protein
MIRIKKLSVFFLLMILAPSLSGAAEQYPGLDDEIKSYKKRYFAKKELYFGLGPIYRIDNLKWSVASDPTGNVTPNVKNEARWENAKLVGVKAFADLPVLLKSRKLALFLSGVTSQAWAADQGGKVYYNSYNGNNRTDKNREIIGNFDPSRAADYELTIKNRNSFSRTNKKYVISTFAGYAMSEQNFRINRSYTVESTNSSEVGKTQNLSSKYYASWSGPIVGASFFSEVNDSHQFTFLAKYHHAKYRAKSDWNIDSSQNYQHPKSFTHEADGYGIIGEIEYRIRYDTGISTYVSLEGKMYKTRDGKAKYFLSDGSQNTVKLHPVSWTSYVTSVGMAFDF